MCLAVQQEMLRMAPPLKAPIRKFTKQKGATDEPTLHLSSSLPLSLSSRTRQSNHTSASLYSTVQRRNRRVQVRCPFGIENCPGCPGSFERHRDDNVTQHRRHFFEVITGVKVLEILSVRSPSAYRNQLIVNFYNAHFPRGISTRFIVFGKVADWSKPRSLAMAAANDCLLLIQFANDSGDLACRKESEKRHGVALQLVRKALQDPDSAQNDGLLAAVDALGLCEILREGLSADDAWKYHSRGLCSLFQARGPETLRNGFARNVFLDGLPAAIIDAILSHRDLVFAEDDWQREMEIRCTGRMARLLGLACRIPTAIARLDHVKMSGCSEAAVELLTELVSLEHGFQTWLLQYYESLPPEKSVIRTISITQLPQFVAKYGTIAGMFPKVFAFPTLLSAVTHTYYWTLLITVREAIYDAATLPGAPQYYRCQRQRLATATEECAGAICQSVPYMALTRNPTVPGRRVICGPLQFALHWYQKCGDAAHAEWCQAIAEKLMPNLSAQTHAAIMRKVLRLPRGLVGWMTMAL